MSDSAVAIMDNLRRKVCEEKHLLVLLELN